MEENKFYAVTTKCGHVGRNYYVPITFAVIAKTRKDAANIGRNIPRTKHDHKDAILDVKEIEYQDYVMLCEENKQNNYLKCSSKQEQNTYCIDLFEHLVEDEHNKKIEHCIQDRLERIKYKMKKTKLFLSSCYSMDEQMYEYVN